MKKTLAFLLLIALLFSCASCGFPSLKPTRTDEAAPTATDAIENDATATPTAQPKADLTAFATSSGEHAVSDGTYLYFTVHSDDDAATMNREFDGLYRTDLSLKNPVRLARGDCHSLALDGDTLYFIMEDFAGFTAVCSIDKNGLAIRRIVSDAAGAHDLGLAGGRLFYVCDGELCVIDDLSSGTINRITPKRMGYTQQVLQAQAASDGTVWLTAQHFQDLSIMLYSYDPAAGTLWGVAGVGSRFAVCSGAVYFFYSKEGQPVYDDYRQYEYLLMKMEEHDDPRSTNIFARFGMEMFAYGPFLFYTKYTEVDEKVSLGTATVSRLYCLDTRTGTETPVAIDDLTGFDFSVRGITEGRLFYDLLNYFSPKPDDVEYADCRSFDLTGKGGAVSLHALARSASDSQAVKDDDAKVQAYLDAKEREREEELKNTPYGPGTSTLYLKADSSRSACYRLVRMDGTTEFMVLLAPGESTKKTFPCGKYVLKVAKGETWISDEEAFGAKGTYSSTNPYTFDAGGAYEISTGTQGSFHGDSQSGFMN